MEEDKDNENEASSEKGNQENEGSDDSLKSSNDDTSMIAEEEGLR